MKIVCQRVAAIVEGSTALSLLSLSLSYALYLALALCHSVWLRLGKLGGNI